MATLPLSEAVYRFQANEDRFDVAVNGDETATFTTSEGAVVPSFQKFIADSDAEVGSILSSATGAAADANAAKLSAQSDASAAAAAKTSAQSDATAASAASASAIASAGGLATIDAKLAAKIDSVPSVRFASGDAAFSVEDEVDIRAFEVSMSGITRAGSLRAGAATVDTALTAPSLIVPSGATLTSGGTAWHWAIRDAEGNIGLGLATDGNVYGNFIGTVTPTTPTEAQCLPTDYIRTIMHRGYSAIYPEETLAAYRACAAAGRYIVEGDIQWSSDAVPVMIHDDTVDRTSNGTGAVSSLSLSALKALDFGSWKGSAFAGEQIVTFAELLAFCRKMNLYMVIEMKAYGWTTAQVQTVFDLVMQAGMYGRVEWQSFDITNLQKMLAIDPKATLHLLKSTMDAAMITSGQSLQTGVNTVYLSPGNASVTQALVTSAHAVGLKVAPYTVDVEATALTLIGYGVDAIFTNTLNLSQIIRTSEGI